jgi:hypothetical protein
MLRTLASRMTYSNVVATLALVAAVGTGGAYAANTIRSSDIVDGEIGSADVKDNSLNTFDVHSFIGEDVIDGTLTGADVANTSSLGTQDIGEEGLFFNNTLIASDIASGAVGSDEVADDALTGNDINESTLAPTTTATFAGSTNAFSLSSGFTKISSKTLPAGSWAAVATANSIASFPNASGGFSDFTCELRNGNSFMGGATDRRYMQPDAITKRSLSLNGGAFIGAGGAEVSLWCLSQTGGEVVASSQIMLIRLDGFS